MGKMGKIEHNITDRHRYSINAKKNGRFRSSHASNCLLVGINVLGRRDVYEGDLTGAKADNPVDGCQANSF